MAYNWNIYFDNDSSSLKLPSIQFFGGHEVNTLAYYHDASVRTDEPHFVFQYTLKGEGCFRYDGEEFRVPAGQGFFCDTHDPKAAYYYPPEGKESYELLFCVFSGDLAIFEEIAEKYGRIFQLDLDSQAIQQFLKYQIRAGDHCRNVTVSTSQSIEMASWLLSEFVNVGEQKKKIVKTAIVDRAKVYILEHIEEKISIQNLAVFLAVTASHFSREFKKETGLSPQRYIDNLRMQHAMKLVKFTPSSIKEIAFRMGFENPAHFNRSFKRIHGITPGQARK